MSFAEYVLWVLLCAQNSMGDDTPEKIKRFTDTFNDIVEQTKLTFDNNDNNDNDNNDTLFCKKYYFIDMCRNHHEMYTESLTIIFWKLNLECQNMPH
jgi:hypothetical protein